MKYRLPNWLTALVTFALFALAGIAAGWVFLMENS